MLCAIIFSSWKFYLAPMPSRESLEAGLCLDCDEDARLLFGKKQSGCELGNTGFAALAICLPLISMSGGVTLLK
jgi:hypothetical protein